MLSIFDNIIAIMIAGVVILLLFSIQQRSTDFNIEQNALYSAKTFSLDFAEWIEADISLTGINQDHADPKFATPTYLGANTQSIILYRDSVVFAPADTFEVQTWYDLDSSAVVTLPDTTIQLYELTRWERMELAGGGFSPWKETGKGPEWISYFRINTLNAQGQTVVAEPQTAFLNVAFTLVLPNIGSKAHINEFNWASTINIRRY